MTAASFLDHLYAHTDTGWLTLFSVDRATGEKPTRWIEIGDTDTAAAQAGELATTGCVWFGVAPRAERLTGGRRGGAADCLTIPALWLDIDIRSDAHASEQLPETLDDALALLQKFPLPATAVVDSGHGLQAWWQLSEPLAGDMATTLLADWGATWAQLGDRHGWHVDNVFDLARVMRLPGTWNRKGEPKLVTILSENWDRTYGVDDIDGHLIPAPVPISPAATRRDLPYIGPERPGDAFNAVADPGSILERAGFHFDHSTPDGARHYRAPHRTKTTDTTGATVYSDGHTTLWSETFARSTGMDVRRPYDAYGLYAYIEHRGDWAAATKALRSAGYGADEIGAPLTPFVPSIAAPGDPWPAPIPLGAQKQQLPTFPTHVFPDWIAAQAHAVAVELQMQPDLPANLALVALATIAAKATSVNVAGKWVEPLNVYIAVAMPPSAGKSPAFNFMTGPIRRHEERLADDAAEVMEFKAQTKRMIEKRMAKAEAADDRDEARMALQELLELGDLTAPRLTADDATPEALVQLLAEQHGKIAILSTEGGLFDLMTGRYSEKANLDVYLKGWSGDTITVDRIGRGQSKVASPALTIGLTVQPSVIAALAEKPELAGRGLTARFMYALPVDNVGHRDFLNPAPSDPAVARAYDQNLTALAVELGAVSAAQIVMDEHAHKELLRWKQDLEDRRVPDGELRPLAEWSTKLESTTIRVAGLLHLAHGHSAAGTLTVDTMRLAIEVGNYWIAHAQAVHDMWGRDPMLDKARIILEFAKGMDSFTTRDLYSKRRAAFPRADETIGPLSILIERGWLRPVDNEWPPRTGGRGQKTPELLVHPSVARHARVARPEMGSEGTKSDEVARHAWVVLRDITEITHSLTTEEHGEAETPAQLTHDAQLYPQDEMTPTGTDWLF